LLAHSIWFTYNLYGVKYKRLHGHCNVPQLYKANPELGLCVMNQRTLYKRLVRGGGQSTLGEKQKKKLENIGFVWEIKARELGNKIFLLLSSVSD